MIKKDLYLYNSISKKKEKFEPINEGFVGMYVCGPTVYSDVHLGNVRTFTSFDIMYRFLMYLGYKVRYVRNITDVGHLLDDGEDRISKGAQAGPVGTYGSSTEIQQWISCYNGYCSIRTNQVLNHVRLNIFLNKSKWCRSYS